MQTQNPYTAPKAQVADSRDDEVGEIKLFSASGRLGRLRYIAYTTGLPMLIMLALGALGALLGPALGTVVMPVMVVGYIVMFVLIVLLTIQRSHDFDATGWTALVMFIPLFNLIFWFIPGTDGSNRFGPRPPPNTAGVKILGLIMPLVFVVGIIAAVALPAYQDYVNRAEAVQQGQ
jgi:uncharacterized membrane protein YhaH (DUF805 family)